MGTILCLVPVSTAQILYPHCDLKTMSTFHGSLWGNKHGDTRFFFRAFAKNSLIKNIFEKEKYFDNRTWFFLENSSALGVFWLRRGLQANHGTVRKSAKSPQPGNQKQVKWSNTVYFNKRSFKFKIKFCVFQVTEAKFCMKVIRIFNAQPVKNTHFKSPLPKIFKRPISWSFIDLCKDPFGISCGCQVDPCQDLYSISVLWIRLFN